MSSLAPAPRLLPPRLFLAAGLAWVADAASASAQTPVCPAPLAAARTLVVVTTQGMNASPARLRLFARDESGRTWRPLGPPESAVVGRRGLAWGNPFRRLARPGEPVKAEGDRRTPAGIYRIGRSFGFAPHTRPDHLVLRPGETICVDGPASPAYNTIVSRKVIGGDVRGEDMGAEPLYRRGLVIDYPSAAGRKAGSCIFLHVWRGPASGTAGCVALPEARVAALQDFAQGTSAIAILPEGALGRFAGCLPGIGAER